MRDSTHLGHSLVVKINRKSPAQLQRFQRPAQLTEGAKRLILSTSGGLTALRPF